MLNAAKAYLTAIDSSTTAPLTILHGLGQDNGRITTPYDFYQEQYKVQSSGVFQALAARTGRGFVWRPGSMFLSRLMPYLAESVDFYSSAFVVRPALIPIESVQVQTSASAPGRDAWLNVEVSRLALKEAEMTPRGLLSRAAAFADIFDLVDGGSNETALYQSKVPVHYSAMPRPLQGLRTDFDRSLIVRNRAFSSRRDSILISPHVDLVSGEAITFAVMLHLSNMVRYRPQHVDELRGGGHWWLFTSWVDRACENFLLAISSRIALEEHLIT